MIKYFKAAMALLFILFLAGTVQASLTKVHEEVGEDGDVFILWVDERGIGWVEHDTGTERTITEMDGNPNPDDSSGASARPTAEWLKEYIKKHYQGKLDKRAGSNTPLDQRQSAQGKGLDPIWNPGEARPAEGDSGSSTEKRDGAWVQNQGKKGGKKGDKNNDDQDEKEKSKPSTHEGGAPKIGQKGSLIQNEVNPNPMGLATAVRMDVRQFSSQSPVRFQVAQQKASGLVFALQQRNAKNQAWSDVAPGSRLSSVKAAGLTQCSLKGLAAGQWRVRARSNLAGAQWSEWTEFSIQGQALNNLNTAPKMKLK